MTELFENNPHLIVALTLGFMCISSLSGGVVKTLFGVILIRRILFFAVPFSAGACGILFLLN